MHASKLIIIIIIHLSINLCRDIDYYYFSIHMIKQVILQVVLAHVIAMLFDRHVCIHRRVKCLHARNGLV